MSHYFTNTIRARLQGRTVRMGHLAKFDFDAYAGFEPAYLWNGFRNFESGGQTWIGMRQLGQIEGLEETQSAVASTIKVSLTGVDSEMLRIAVTEDRSHYVGRMLIVYMQQFFDDDWQPLDDPYALCAGIMDSMEVSRQQREDGATIRTISVSAPNMFYGRRQPAFGYHTDGDQKARHPGDRGGEFIAELQNTSIPVPWLGAPSNNRTIWQRAFS